MKYTVSWFEKQGDSFRKCVKENLTEEEAKKEYSVLFDKSKRKIYYDIVVMKED